MAESAVCSVIQNLGKLKSSETRLSQNTRQLLERIDEKLRGLLAISKMADFRQREDDQIRDWVAKTRRVAYDVEDLLDMFAIESLSTNERSFIRRSSEKTLKTLPEVESRIFAQETEWHACSVGSGERGEIRNSDWHEGIERNYSSQEMDFVGLDEDTEKLVAHLVNEDGTNSCHVVSVIGRGGIGKTALARKIYHHGNVRSHFSAFAWVIVSPQWQPEEVLQRILCKLMPEKREKIRTLKNTVELIKELFEVQKTKKCFVVLDDVCGKNVWDSLRHAFLNHKSGSKVLLTTRVEEIAHYINTDTTCCVHEQRHLNEEKSWELLQNKASHLINISDSSSFGSCNSDVEEDESGNLDTLLSGDGIEDLSIDSEELGRDMVGQCGGLPLAINLLGKILTNKSTFSEWEAVQQSFKSHLRERGIGEHERVYEMLALNYLALPYHIKQCFVYLGNFPEYYTIPTRKLYQLWAAEGFIQLDNHPGEEDGSSTEIAERYLSILEENCMVQVQVEESISRFKSCQLHEFVREMFILKGNEENFQKRSTISDELDINVSSSESTSTRSSEASAPVSSYFEMIFIREQEDIKNVRSALVYSKLSKRLKLQSILKWLCDSFKLLRVLDLERLDFDEEQCESIGNLVHLRYLSFRDSRFTKVPSTIGNLRFLQTLDLRVAFNVNLTIPDVLGKLNHLRHLYLPPQQNRSNKLQLSNLRYLEILKNFDPSVSDFRDIPKLKKLKKLTVIFCVGMENVKALCKYLTSNSTTLSDTSFRIHYNFTSAKDLTLLEQVIGCVHLRKLDLVGQIDKLLDHSHFSKRLTKLTLRNSELKEDPLAILEKLPNVYSLTLRKNAYMGRRICCSAQGFFKLRTLEFQGLACLEDWIIEEGSLPNLRHIKIDTCTKLVKLPEGIKFLGTIREIEIVNMSEAFKQTAELVLEASGNNLCKVTFNVTDCNSSSRSKLEQGTRHKRFFETFTPSIIPKEWQNP